MGRAVSAEQVRRTRNSDDPEVSGLAGSDWLLATILIAAATAVMFQAMRVFVSYMVFVIDQSNRAELAVAVFGTFLGIGLGGVLVWLLGWRATVLVGMAGFVVTRGIVQFWELPEGRFILGAIAIVTWGWFMIALLARFRAAAAVGLALGVGLDLAIRTTFMTVDLPWIPNLAQHAVAILLLAVIAGVTVVLVRRARLDVPAPRTALSLLAIGPAFALYHVAVGNFGFAQQHGGVTFPTAALLLSLGVLLGIACLALAGRYPGTLMTRLATTAVAGLVLALGLWLLWVDHAVSAVGLVLSPAALLLLLGAAALGRPRAVDRPGIGWITLYFTGGLLLQVGLLFLYYMYSGPPLFLVVIASLVVLFALLAGASVLEGPAGYPRLLGIGGSGVALVLLLAAGWHLLTFDEPDAGAPAGETLTIMTYNLQNGFDLENRWRLDRQADTIEAQNPDVVVIQEISRGWLVLTGVDQVLWLSQRLDMPYVFGNNSDDWVWGNLILSRVPILESRNTQYSVTDNLKRGAIEVRVPTEAGDIWIYGTHLDNPREAAEVRIIQGEEFMEFWGGEKRPALLLGDFNADPDDDLIGRLADAGLLDTGLVLGPDAFTSQDRRRIDYILATDDIEVVDIHIPLVWTSDHLPVVATIRLSGGE
jgi:endonuclease/exonuclease/phosphatase family metal-dependent hydrolase